MYEFIFDQKFVLCSKSHKSVLRYFVKIDFIWCFFLFGLRKMYDFNLICIKHFLRTEKVAGLVKVIVCNLTLLLLFKCDKPLKQNSFCFWN